MVNGHAGSDRRGHAAIGLFLSCGSSGRGRRPGRQVLRWALALGADCSGNATPIGASANIIVANLATDGCTTLRWLREPAARVELWLRHDGAAAGAVLPAGPARNALGRAARGAWRPPGKRGDG